MDLTIINQHLSRGIIEPGTMFPHVEQLQKLPYVFDTDFAIQELPTEPGILLIRGARQYGKSTWLETQIIKTIKTFGPGTAFYLNGDFIPDREALSVQLEALALSFTSGAAVKRIFVDEITAINDWEIVLKRLVDNGTLRSVLVVTTGSKATDLRRGTERLPGRKGKLSQTNFLFPPISYASFHKKAHRILKEKTLVAYLISGGSPIACSELMSHGVLPEYVIQLVRDWVEGEITKSGRLRSALLNISQVLFRFGGTPVGQAKLAREAALANNTVAQSYIEILNDLGCVIPSYPKDIDKNLLILRKPCKYHYMNLLVATAYHPTQIRSPDDFLALPESQQGIWMEWLVAQELQRRIAIQGGQVLEPMAFYQSKEHEIDFIDPVQGWLEVKRGSATPLEFVWFVKQFPQHKLHVINNGKFSTDKIHGLTLEDFLLHERE